MPPDFRPLLHQTPTHADTEDRFLFGLTGRQFLLAVVTVVLAYGLWDWLGPSWPPLLRAIPPLVLAATGVDRGLRPAGGPLLLGVRLRASARGPDPPGHRLAPLPEGLVSGAGPTVAPAEPAARRLGSVQETHFRIETLERDTIRLVGHEYRAVVECVGVRRAPPADERAGGDPGRVRRLPQRPGLPHPAPGARAAAQPGAPHPGRAADRRAVRGPPGDGRPGPRGGGLPGATSTGCTSRPCSWTGAATW